ncbi:hypothetical protein [Subtercola sp. RTI3]|uniref:hypothetical protein n=1 Tax=Subtercola sp. RTI3 TaxID=3048639 RepID=UPI002B23337B|nr:hypothetical protein [Subtercola sp. RTI3]MEA9983697.1 hypothetical protein [Subtercola sp. RTI3]
MGNRIVTGTEVLEAGTGTYLLRVANSVAKAAEGVPHVRLAETCRVGAVAMRHKLDGIEDFTVFELSRIARLLGVQPGALLP